jgi:hypothetical protein
MALAVKPNSSLYHAMKFLRVSLSLAIDQVLVLAIKAWYYLAVGVVWLYQLLRLTLRGRVMGIVPLPLIVQSRMGRMN